eukprot:c17967_g2_i1.p1 GENE.c17967_g2_i1~~c17967_g2_i1.p1  ORF type:complete len:596 (-),score=249.07 c17967_g2_i1:21-1808(-)
MDEKWDFEEENEGEEDDDGDFVEQKHQRDCVVFLIDARRSMLSSGYYFKCLDAARSTLKSRIIACDRDQLGICLFGTEKKNNQMDFDYMSILVPLDEPKPQTIQMLDDVVKNQKECDWGHSDKDWRSSGFPMHEAFWLCQQMFSDALVPKDATKRIFVLTDDDNPVQSNQILRDRFLRKAHDMLQSQHEILVFPLSPANKTFDLSVIWKGITSTEYGEILDTEDLMTIIRKKVFQKRALTHIKWAIGPGIEISIGIYSTVVPTRPPQPKYLDTNHNPLVSRTKYFSSLTVKEVNPDQILRGTNFGGETVDFTNEELKEIKSAGERGLKLLGFKDAKRLKDYHNITHSYFVFPSEKIISGSSKSFFAFHSQMLKQNKIAICKLVKSETSRPKLVALVPSVKSMNPDNDIILSHEGMHMIVLPWANEIREPPIPPPMSDITPQQQQAADDLVDSLKMKQFSSDLFSNPAIQKYYACLQAMALGQSGVEEVEDDLVPNSAALHHANRQITNFREAFFGDENSYEAKLAVTRTTKSTTSRAPRPLLGDDGKYDWRGLAERDQLSLLSVVDLKIYLTENRLPASGKKQDIINRIKAHLMS